MSLPIFTGGRIKADETIARAGVDEQKARLSLTRELADLDGASARAELRAPRCAAWQASAGTIQQAARAYEIAELRYREGLSTQLELSDSRLLLAQAQVNRASAARSAAGRARALRAAAAAAAVVGGRRRRRAASAAGDAPGAAQRAADCAPRRPRSRSRRWSHADAARGYFGSTVIMRRTIRIDTARLAWRRAGRS